MEQFYESPTPVWVYTDVIYATASPELKNSANACPDPSDIKSSAGDEISPYPSGFFLADEDSEYGWNSPGAISTTLPTQLRDWMINHVEADRANPLTNLAQCKLGAGRGVPTAYVPYNEITASLITTSTILGNYGTQDRIKHHRRNNYYQNIAISFCNVRQPLNPLFHSINHNLHHCNYKIG
ncbi:hypothetical protein DID88_003612 [Monilinia fructigena]|uniref:Uncharacterized protein n=1 Tax=Monilinia fructigena TaxID=38457 RepID=A0A395IV71_9HELO|nr:hypothetical protein DID88_003612 [Monilinia fructigena]